MTHITQGHGLRLNIQLRQIIGAIHQEENRLLQRVRLAIHTQGLQTLAQVQPLFSITRPSRLR